MDVKRFVIGGGISAQKILVEEINRQFNTIIKSNPILEVNIPKILRLWQRNLVMMLISMVLCIIFAKVEIVIN